MDKRRANEHASKVGKLLPNCSISDIYNWLQLHENNELVALQAIGGDTYALQLIEIEISPEERSSVQSPNYLKQTRDILNLIAEWDVTEALIALSAVCTLLESKG